MPLMKRIVLTLVLALGIAPLAAGAQGYPNGGPPPEMRAKMEQARGDAKTASYNALSADHRTKVQAVVDKFNGGTIADPRDAASQIDAILTPDEAKAVLARRQAMRDAMRAAFAQNGGAGGPVGQNGAAGQAPGGQGRNGQVSSAQGPNGQAGSMEHHDGGQADAGRFLLGVAADPQKLHAAMRAERERSQQ